MVRLFKTHKVRQQVELDGLWEFTALNETDLIPKQFDYTLAVPGCWEMHPDFLTYRGRAAYKRNIELEEKTALRLEFKGVSHTADIYFDGKHIKNHYNAYTPFSVIIPEAEKGIHEMIVLVDNTFSEKSALHIGNDYYTYGGLIRPVVFEKISDCFIERIEFMPSKGKGGGWQADVAVIISNITSEDKKVSLKAQLSDTVMDFGDVEVKQNSSVRISKTCSIKNVQEWSHNSPKLYLLEAVIYDKATDAPLDDLIERVGFREISISGQQLLVNGNPVLLMGYNRHEDHANAGCSLPFSLMVKDIQLIKDTGANAVRTSHYPNDELFLDLCDENGLYVWEEHHARGLSLEKMQNPNFEWQSMQCNEEMVQNHYNHPSIVVWGLFNECSSDCEEGRKIYQKQYEQIRKMDRSRPLTSASNKIFTDICLDFVDIVSLNIYAGWYHYDDIGEYFERVDAWLKQCEGRNKPVILSEFGAGAVYGFREPTKVLWSEERQADILDECLSVYLNRPQIAGAFIWQFSDCRVTEEEGWALKRPRTKNNKGIVDEYRRPKLCYEIVKTHFTNKNKSR